MSALRSVAAGCHRVKAVVFDWAGTIVDYGCFSPAGVFLDVFKNEGVDVSVAEARRPMGIHKKMHITEMLNDPSIRDRWTVAKGSAPTQADIDRMYANFTPLQMASVRQYSSLIPDFVKRIMGKNGTQTSRFQGAAEKMVLVVNCSLPMGPGKIAAQCSHGAVGLVQKLQKTQDGSDYIEPWLLAGQAKIVLRGKDTGHLQQMRDEADSLGVPCILIRDAGRTQVPSGSVTVLAIVGPRNTVDMVSGRLKLL